MSSTNQIPRPLDSSSDSDYDSDQGDAKADQNISQPSIDDYFQRSKERRIKKATKASAMDMKTRQRDTSTQLVLLVGQKNTTVKCPLCGTLYDSISKEDVRFHEKICKDIRSMSLPNSVFHSKD